MVLLSSIEGMNDAWMTCAWSTPCLMHGHQLSWLQRRAMVTRVTLYLTNWGIVSSSLLSTFFPFPHLLLMSPYPSVATSTPIAQLPPTPQSTPRNSSSCSGLSVANALSFSANSNLMNYSLPKSESKVCVQIGSIVVKHCPSNKKI